MVETKQVFAVAIAASVGSTSKLSGVPGAARFIEDAMTEAVRRAQSQGVTDPEKIREVIQAARAKAKEELKGRLPR
jgi:ketopantoate reductase